jgi:uncharacterized metal-binding protein YceD (DUF177 family)
MATKQNKPGEFSWMVPVAVAEIEEGGLHLVVTPSEAERDEIARAAALRELPQLTAEFEIMPLSGGEVRVQGRVTATVGQTCVVTLEPMENVVDEPVDLLFAPSTVIDETASADTDEDSAEDPPEPIVDGRIDLARLAVEFLILGIDPYPRRPGAVFEPVHSAPDPADHPFARLAALKEPKKET